MTASNQAEIPTPNDIEQLRIRVAGLAGEVAQLKARPGAIDAETLLENTTDGFLVYDSQFHFTYLNGDGERLLGRLKRELLGKSQWDSFPETIGSEVERQYRRAMKEQVSATFDHYDPESETWLEIRLSPSSKGGLLVWLRDITARRQTEVQREGLLLKIQSERQILSEIIEKSPVAISVVRAPDFIYEVVNPAFQALAPGKQILGCRFTDIWGEASGQLVSNLETVIATGQALEAMDSVLTIQRDAGTPPETIFVTWSWIPLIGPSGSADRILTLAVETTDRKRQEDRLRNSEARLKRAQRMANLGSWEQDLESGELELSEDACRIFGVPPEGCRTTMETLLSLVHPDDRAPVRETIQTAPSRGGCSQVDHRIVRPDGTERFVRQYTEPLPNEVGGGSLLGTVQDVTDYKHLEEKFRRSQRLEGIARLAGGVAHDFNNLLVVINGYAQMIVSELRDEDPLREQAQEIIKAGNRAAALTRQLLAFGRKQAIRPRVLDLDKLLSDLEKMLRRLIREDIELKQNLSTGLWSVTADPDQVEQVIMNLVVNARDAMPKGGVLTIGTSNVELAAQDVKGFLDLTPGRYVSLTVTDTGTGMTPETKRHLFEPFFTTKPAGEGTGLGLSMVYGIVKQHGGEVSFYSEPGVGSTFKIYWPATDQSAAVPSSLERPRIPYSGTETVLLVEDDHSVRELVRQMLLLQGYKVLETGQSAEAAAMAAQHNGPIDLLLTDVVMPKLCGQELAEQIMALRPGIKTVFMSGYAGDTAAKHGAFDQGAFFLQKPFEADALWRLLRQALDPGRAA
ncbi:MAG: PAS domain-containing protein [Candidatus Sulfopaludibacter sp.]|nr:PAS domain-containing protein [Candidatus Sulfopaludibacter sp.]